MATVPDAAHDGAATRIAGVGPCPRFFRRDARLKAGAADRAYGTTEVAGTTDPARRKHIRVIKRPAPPIIS